MMDDWPRHHTTSITGPDGLRVDVYLRDDRVGHGVCSSVYDGEREVMRFDLFDRPAHEHWDVLNAPRIYYPPAWTFDQSLQFAMNSLIRNLRIPLRRRLPRKALVELADLVAAEARMLHSLIGPQSPTGGNRDSAGSPD